MGFSLTWTAVKGASPQTVHAALDLGATGRREDFADSDITGVSLPGDWYAVIANHGLRLTKNALLARLSQIGDVVACFVEEHVMYSSAEYWSKGQRLWSVTHASEKGIENLDTEGEPPPTFAAIRDRLLSEQAAAGGKDADVDCVFDVPVELAQSITG